MLFALLQDSGFSLYPFITPQKTRAHTVAFFIRPGTFSKVSFSLAESTCHCCGGCCLKEVRDNHLPVLI